MAMTSELLVSSLIESIVKAVKSGNKLIRRVFFAALGTIMIAIIFSGTAELFTDYRKIFMSLASVLGIIGVLQIIFIGVYYDTIEKTKQKEMFIEFEKRAQEHPEIARTAWDLARLKLESYLNRNLIHVRWIFVLILAIMIIGFGIIIYGILKIYESPSFLNPSIIVTVSGIIVEFIAATFLIIYKSTMQQAQEYVNVLERINAVGMAVQILDTINSPDSELKEKTKSELVKELLLLYKK